MISRRTFILTVTGLITAPLATKAQPARAVSL